MTFAPKLLLVICGSVCVTIASIAAYFIVKNSGKQIETETDTKKKRNELNVKRLIKTRYETRRLKVPKLAVRAIIGNNGSVIKLIETKTNTKLHFDDDYVSVSNNSVMTPKRECSDSDDWCDHNDGCDGNSSVQNEDYVALQLNQFRYISISGSHTNIVCAEDMLNEMIATEMRNNEFDRISIPIGCDIIGAFGDTIKDIQDKSGATIKVYGSLGYERTALVRGSDSQRIKAKQLIESFISSMD